MLEEQGSWASQEEEWSRNGSSLSLAHVLNSLPLPLIVLDTSGRVTHVGERAKVVMGRGSKEILGLPFEELLLKGGSPSQRETFTEALKKGLAGEPARVSLTFSTPLGTPEYRCTLVPTTDAQGTVDGAVVLLREERSKDQASKDGRSIDSIRVLAKTSSDLLENADLKEIIEAETARLVTSLGLDFAIFRILTPDEKPLMLCHGIDYKEAREVLETPLIDGTQMYISVCKGRELVLEDLPEIMESLRTVPKARSMACITIHWTNKAYGCAVFGTRRPGVSVKAHYPILKVYCNQVGISLRNAALRHELVHRNDELRGLYETTQAMSSMLELDELLHIILQTARDLVAADNGFIFMLDPHTGKLRSLSKITEANLSQEIELDVGEGITGHVVKTGKGLLVERADLDPRAVTVPGTPDEDPSSIICVPLRFSDDLLGAMTLEKRPGVPFTPKEYELIELFSLQASMAIHRASQYDKIRSAAANTQMYNVLLTHDVANFNVPIHGFLEILLKDPKLDDRQRRYVRSALVQSDNISELISDIRELSRLRSKGAEAPLERVDIIPVIMEAKEDIFSNAVYEDIETRYTSSVESAVTIADAFLKDLFYNLLSNACKYGRGAPVEIEICEEKKDDRTWWKIQIKDGGKGIPDERKAGLFKRYDKLDTAHGSDGHGLGLSVVGALCERYGGYVWAEDRVIGDPSRGSVFVVLLPKATESGRGV
ncbi:MAG: GAF domain-containing protein [Methanomassiliicoccus sp.]|nr:GAF domain-containing protein [Methanomassiliicoccus sp.]